MSSRFEASRVAPWKRRIASALMILGALAVVVYVAISLVIGSSVRELAAVAQREHPQAGDDVTALIAYVDSPAHTLRDRNRAAWALGQLGDARALPVLEEQLTGKPCAHDSALCQHELGKAIRLCRGAPNVTAWMWRRGSPGS